MTTMNWPKWVIYTVGVAIVLIAGVGACTGTVVKNWPKPAPAPAPSPKPNPSDIWQALSTPSSNVVQGVLELPAAMEVSSSRRYIPIAAKCDNEVRWLVSSSLTGTVDALESRILNSIMIFPKPNADDTIVVVAYTSQDDKPTSSAITIIKVKADKLPPGPAPTPSPDPPPDPPAGQITKLHVTFLLDPAKQTRAISDVINNKELRQYLEERGHEIHELSIRDNLKALGLDTYIQGKSPPLLILQTKKEPNVKEGEVLSVTPLTTIQQVKDTINKTLVTPDIDSGRGK